MVKTITLKKHRTRKCSNCKEKFEIKFFNQKFCKKEACLDIQSKIVFDNYKKKNEKDWKKRKQELKESLKTNSDYLKELEKVFNKYVRLRDKKQKCISCNTHLKGKYDAGHYYSKGSYPELRFNLDNVHGQCVYCNQHLSGNLINYGENLVKKIGKDRFEKLKSLRNKPRKYSIPELKDMKLEYTLKVKALENE